jgi:DNA-binding PadR family transcriptional regulator
MDVKTLCLGALSRGDASGYEIKKAFEEGPLSHIHEASFGAIYPALTELERQGLVTGREMAQEKRPDKKVFTLTEDGLQALQLALLAPPVRDKTRSDFLFILFLGHLIEASRLAELIDGRIAWYQDCLSRMEACDLSAAPPGEAFVHGLGLAVYTAARDYLVAHRAELLDAGAERDRLVAE